MPRINTEIFILISKYFCCAALTLSTLIFIGCKEEYRQKIEIAGQWAFEIDSISNGEPNNYPLKIFSDLIVLPGTMDTNARGYPNTDSTETTFLSRKFKYTGKAWYCKKVHIPDNWSGKHTRLVIERTKPTKLWVNGNYAGTSNNISTSQQYDLTDLLVPGENLITILVDNGESVPKILLENNHAYTEHTQTNWNGMIGDIYVEALNKVHISNVVIRPDTEDKSVTVIIELSETLTGSDVELSVEAKSFNSAEPHKAKKAIYTFFAGEKTLEIKYPLGNNALLWSEFTPSLYELDIHLHGYDRTSATFGLREFATSGNMLTINGQRTFLRGKHDACVFPVTGHVPMGVDSWLDYFSTLKEYGINHVRFHSWCPPEACFKAADITGIYLQPELPVWGEIDGSDSELISFLQKEGLNILKEYGNYSSFVMFALGNELTGDQDKMRDLVDSFRERSSDRLYAYGANNFLGFRGQVTGEDFLVTCRIGQESEKGYETHTRGSFSFADAFQGGYINNTYPNTNISFDSAIGNCTVPVISHETGQFQIFPDFGEIAKYTGVLEARNMEIFRQRLSEAGMEDQARDFFLASGKWAVELYKADIEMCLRTADLGGFQLLDIQDYPGQGSAYIGILNAFMENKGLIEPEQWREFCCEVVPLFLTEKLCWSTTETLTGEIKLANYSDVFLPGKELRWELKGPDDRVIEQGNIQMDDETTVTGLYTCGRISVDLSPVKTAQKLLLSLYIPETPYRNNYSIWAYPDKGCIGSVNTYVSTALDEKTMRLLEEGGNVLLFPDRKQYEGQTVEGLFQTDYWNYRMFKFISELVNRPVSPGTMGLLIDTSHPVFENFPTDFHTNWQWYSIVKNSYPLILDSTATDFIPIVQAIDNIERNHKLGLLFEYKIGRGSLLVCMADLEPVVEKPEVRQFYSALVDYVDSEKFDPQHEISYNELLNIFSSGNNTVRINELHNISYD